MDLVVLQAGIHAEGEGGEHCYLLFPVEWEVAAEDVVVESPEAPIGPFEDQEGLHGGWDRNVGVAGVGHDGCHE